MMFKLNHGVISRLPVLAGCLSLILALAGFGPTAAYGQYYGGTYIDLNSPLSQDIKILTNEHCPQFQLGDIDKVTREVQLAAADYSLEPGQLLALMVAEENYAGYPQARLYYFNLDMGSLADNAVFPIAWFDSERVARSYAAEYQRYEDSTPAIAAYFVGSRTLPSDGDINGLGQGMIDLVGMVMRLTAEYSHLGERSGPQIVQPDENTPATSYEDLEYDYSEIEEAYIENMMYFNRNLDDNMAREIFQAIHLHASDYQTVDARLLMALVATESSFNPFAVSHCGAQGLGQLMPFTAERFGVEDPFDVDENINATFAYLAREIDRWEGHDYPLDRILASYNAGAGAVEQYDGIPPYTETRNFVRIVVNRYFYFLPEEERSEKINGLSCHYRSLLGLGSN